MTQSSNDAAVGAAVATREKFGSRLGFILISAGCAIGLGNVWRFPYITGEYGGGAFILLYLTFLLLFALPIMIMEFSVGRGGQKGIARQFDVLEPTGTKWHVFKWVAIAGNYLLMMFYTVVAGWMLNYMVKMASGEFAGQTTEAITAGFGNMLGNPGELIFWMVVVCAIGLFVCNMGVRKGVERITKVMMLGLFALILILAVRSVTLEGAGAGLSFYLKPDFSKIFGSWAAFSEAAYAAMGQAFFTLSIGIGSMSIFGSYIDKDRSLTGEAVTIGALDTFVAFTAGLIIFPACFAYGISPDSGPGLVFMTLPNVFEQMWMGQLWGTLFFLFMGCAALSTVIAVFENIICFWMDQWDMPRKKAVLINCVLLPLLSLPCALGFNVWSFISIPAIGDIQAIEDFIVSNNLLPIGSLVFLAFCMSKRGWGWENFLKEADAGQGIKFPKVLYYWMKFGVPALMIVVFIMGWMNPIKVWLGLA